jgi:hypothetical protein
LRGSDPGVGRPPCPRRDLASVGIGPNGPQKAGPKVVAFIDSRSAGQLNPRARGPRSGALESEPAVQISLLRGSVLGGYLIVTRGCKLPTFPGHVPQVLSA